MRHWSVLRCLSLLVLSAMGCSGSPLESLPPPTATLLVTNATCTPGPCAPLTVFAFPQKEPYAPAGFWKLHLGDVSGPSACLTIPATAFFLVNNDTIKWSTKDSLSLGSITSLFNPWPAMPSTPMFVAATAAGWSVSLPGSAVPSRAGPCSSA